VSKIQITDAITIDDREVDERFVRAMGKDGQNADRAATAVELRFDINRSSLPGEIKQSLVVVGGRHVTRDGVLVVVSREYRSQARNREAAHSMLATLIRRAARETTRLSASKA
jgi:ribosome-associated protein